MRMLSAQDVADLLGEQARTAEARAALVAEIRTAHDEAVEAGEIPADTPPAAAITLDDLSERGLTRTGKQGNLVPTLKGGRNGKGDIANVKTLDEATVLVVLRPVEDVEDEDEDEASNEASNEG